MMKNIILIFSLLLSTSLFAQIEGTWNGNIEIPMNKLPFVLHISNKNNGLKATFDSPNQGGFGLEIPEIRFEDNTLYLKHPQMMMNYEGKLENDVINGTFTQGSQSFTLNLTKGKFKRNRPQEPQSPFDYHSEDITFENKEDGINLAGTLTLPKGNGKFPAVVLVSGSGPQDRNEEIRGHKPFLVLSDYFTTHGYAVLRYDKRGIAESGGNYSLATVFDFANDTKAAIEYLKNRKEIDSKKIGVLGHSEGGQVAQIIASEDKSLNFIILMAAPGTTGDEILLYQTKILAEASNLSQSETKEILDENQSIYEIIKRNNDIEKIKLELISYFKSNPNYSTLSDEQINEKSASLSTNWMKEFIQFNPQNYLAKIDCNVLAINGTKDIQVPSVENLAGITKELGVKGNLDIISYDGLNHMFQPAQTGLPDEYGTIETTIEPKVLEDIVKWLNEKVKY
ncbi:alpha/beta hydrolase family protein [Avrilella dinanensis]|uniref:Xaa-Pro dipeptidyl-peptidase-like domain-containing protein n=1 Tax=Avrilella dinanensis TaxID=2008672 RepID=A0A2M9R4M1_9FLAO|nr:CocE/NonD family hydrolase [Avrilella dinanensis]PJR03816.1 hypothetical protein CDL10_04215 [Avrilella dinanensis]